MSDKLTEAVERIAGTLSFIALWPFFIMIGVCKDIPEAIERVVK